jgi:tRNA A-37 threonylcarbamoyl transferase component Bud32
MINTARQRALGALNHGKSVTCHLKSNSFSPRWKTIGKSTFVGIIIPGLMKRLTREMLQEWHELTAFRRGRASLKKDAPPCLTGFLGKWMHGLPATFTEGTILKKGSRSTVARVDIEGTSFVLKTYKLMSIHKRIRYALTESRCFQSWRLAQMMRSLGVEAATPWAVIEEYHTGLPGRAMLVLEEVPGKSLGQFVKEQIHSEGDLEIIASKLRQIFALLRSARITHGDLKASNILVDHHLEPRFVDTDGARLHFSALSYNKAQARDQKRFEANWENLPTVRKIFDSVFQGEPSNG